MTYAPPPSYQQAPAPAYASWIIRVAGALVDGIPGGILIGIGMAVDGGSIDSAGVMHGPGVIYYICYLLTVAFNAWNRWIQGGKTGQSIGRKVVGIKLVDANTGQPIGAGKAFLRDICHIADTFACLVGWLFPLWDAKKQTFADKIVSTVVVSANS